jgi:hypothetical protein
MSTERKGKGGGQFRVPGTSIRIDEEQDGLPIGERIAELMDPGGENLNGPDAFRKARKEHKAKQSA